MSVNRENLGAGHLGDLGVWNFEKIRREVAQDAFRAGKPVLIQVAGVDEGGCDYWAWAFCHADERRYDETWKKKRLEVKRVLSRTPKGYVLECYADAGDGSISTIAKEQEAAKVERRSRGVVEIGTMGCVERGCIELTIEGEEWEVPLYLTGDETPADPDERFGEGGDDLGEFRTPLPFTFGLSIWLTEVVPLAHIRSLYEASISKCPHKYIGTLEDVRALERLMELLGGSDIIQGILDSCVPLVRPILERYQPVIESANAVVRKKKGSADLRKSLRAAGLYIWEHGN